MKTNKTYTQRLKVTKTGKILARRPGQSHFRNRQTRNQQLEKKRWRPIAVAKKVFNRFLAGDK